MRHRVLRSGVGSLIGTALGPWVYPPPPEGQGTQEEQILAAYGGTFLGIKVGMALGLIAGVAYAVLVRRSRLRRATRDAEPSAAT